MDVSCLTNSLYAGGIEAMRSSRVGCRNEQQFCQELELLAELFCLLFLRQEKEVALRAKSRIH